MIGYIVAVKDQEQGTPCESVLDYAGTIHFDRPTVQRRARAWVAWVAIIFGSFLAIRFLNEVTGGWLMFEFLFNGYLIEDFVFGAASLPLMLGGLLSVLGRLKGARLALFTGGVLLLLAAAVALVKSANYGDGSFDASKSTFLRLQPDLSLSGMAFLAVAAPSAWHLLTRDQAPFRSHCRAARVLTAVAVGLVVIPEPLRLIDDPYRDDSTWPVIARILTNPFTLADPTWYWLLELQQSICLLLPLLSLTWTIAPRRIASVLRVLTWSLILLHISYNFRYAYEYGGNPESREEWHVLIRQMTGMFQSQIPLLVALAMISRPISRLVQQPA